MLAKNMMGHPQDQLRLKKETERGNKREKRASQKEKDGERSRE